MITRHHLTLACGSTIILYLPLVFENPFLLPAVIVGVCVGVILPDIQMKRPGRFTPLSPVWVLVQIFKRTIVRLYITLCKRTCGMQLIQGDKRLTHSLPCLFFLTAIIAAAALFFMLIFPTNPELNYFKVFFAGIIVGLLFHFLEDICTKKGLCIMYPFNEAYLISGSIRPCNREDSRIRNFHILTAVSIAAVILFYLTGSYPEYLKWLVSTATLVACTVMMLQHANVRMTVSA